MTSVRRYRKARKIVSAGREYARLLRLEYPGDKAWNIALRKAGFRFPPGRFEDAALVRRVYAIATRQVKHCPPPRGPGSSVTPRRGGGHGSKSPILAPGKAPLGPNVPKERA